MNKFEEALQHVPYSTDCYEYRCNNLEVVAHFIESEDCEWSQVWERESPNLKVHSIVFFIYGQLYVWTDFIENGLIESSQLDRPVNDYISAVLYCNVENAHAFAPLLFTMIDEGKIKRIV